MKGFALGLVFFGASYAEFQLLDAVRIWPLSVAAGLLTGLILGAFFCWLEGLPAQPEGKLWRWSLYAIAIALVAFGPSVDFMYGWLFAGPLLVGQIFGYAIAYKRYWDIHERTR